MLRQRSEIVSFSREDIERIVRYVAKQQQITSSMFIKFGEQQVRWTPDGGIDVVTKFEEGGIEDIPPAMPVRVIAEERREKKHK